MAGAVRNWAGNIGFAAEEVCHPTSLDDVRSLAARGSKIRVLGSGHSFNDIADTPGSLISLAKLPSLLEIDSAAATVQVGASVRYAELSRWLHDKGYALHNLASLPHISVAGSIATATHGSGDGNGNLATAVSGLDLVTAGGDLVSLSRDRDGDRFSGAVVGLGALGIVVSVTLDIGPTFDVRQRVYEGLPLGVLDERFSEVVSGACSVSLFTTWRDAWIDQVWVKERVDPADDGPMAEDWFGARPADGPRHPVPGMSAVACTEQLGVAGPWFDRLPHFRPDFAPSSSGDELQSEFLLPRQYAVEALHALNEIRDRVAAVLQVCEVRTIAADDLWMSTSYGRDTVALHFTWVKDADAVLPVLDLIEERLAPLDARPHWGKLFTTSADALRSRYPRLADFHALARHYDPNGTFTNDFLARHLFAELD